MTLGTRRIRRARFAFAAGVLAAMAAMAGDVVAQPTAAGYPNRAIRLVVPFGAGTQSDIVARLMGIKLSESLVQPVVVENHPGASGNIGGEIVAKAPADGYTLLLGGSLMTLLPSVMGPSAVDPVAAYAPVAKLAEPPIIIVAHPSLGVKTLPELLALARSRQGGLAYATAGVGSVQHLIASIIARKAGVELLHVPYANSQNALKDVIAGEVKVYLSFLGPLNAGLKAGQIVALAVASERRVSMWPDIPTVVEAGFPEAVANPWNGILAPAGTPPEIVSLLNREFARIVRMPDIRERFALMGMEPLAPTPEEFAAEIRSAAARWPAIARDAGIRH